MPILKKTVASLVCVLFVVTYSRPEIALGQNPPPPAQGADQQAPAPLISPDELDSLVAPIALYPDSLLSQVLVASTYPLEVVQLEQFLEKNKTLKDKALTAAVEKQDWDPSIQSMAALPDVAKRMSDNIKWTSDLGNAFLAQQSDVMDAVQRMRKKAEGTGALKSTPQQKVETQTVENKQVVVIQPSSPEVVYVPSYNPVVVYGAPPVVAYPYPPMYYPPVSTGAVVAASMISFGVGLAIGAAWGGGWGYGCGWGHNNVNVNINNNIQRNTNINRSGTGNINRGGAGGGNWQHNPSHRGGAPYPNQQTANRFGGTTAGSSMADRQSNARRQESQAGNRQGQGQGNRGGQGQSNVGGGNRGGQASAGNRPAQQPSAGNRQAQSNVGQGNRGGGGGAAGGDRIGNQNISRGGGSERSGFGGGSGGYSGSNARASSSRGSSSMSRPAPSRGGGGGGRRR